MKMLSLATALVIAVSIVFVAAAEKPKSRAPAPGTVSGETVPAALASVKAAKLFSIGGIGYAGTKSSAELSFRKVLTAPDAPALCLTLTKEATPEGRLYGLLGLRLLDAKAYAAAAPAFQKDRAKVNSAAGCSLFTTTVARVAQEIADGKMN